MHVTKLLFQELKVRPTLTPEEHRRFHFCAPGGLQAMEMVPEPLCSRVRLAVMQDTGKDSPRTQDTNKEYHPGHRLKKKC